MSVTSLGDYAPPPKAVKATKNDQPVEVEPGDKEVTGFIFKVQALLDHPFGLTLPDAVLDVAARRAFCRNARSVFSG